MRYLLLAFSVVFALALPVGLKAQESTEGAESEAQTDEQAQTDEPAQADEEAQPEEEEGERRVRRLGDVVGEGSEEFSMDIPDLGMPAAPLEDVPEVSLPDPEQDERLQSLLRARAFAPNDPENEQALSDLLDEVEADIRAALVAENYGVAQRMAAVVREIEPGRPIIGEVSRAVERAETVGAWLRQAQAALEAGQLTAPPDENAVDLFNQVLEVEPENTEALSGLAAVHEALLADALALARDDLDFEGAEARIVEAEDIHEAPEAVAEVRQSIADFRSGYIDELDDQVLAQIDEGSYDEAESGLTELVALGHDRERIDSLQASLADARRYGSFRPGQAFSERIDRLGISGPRMVVVPAGGFMMGSPQGEDDRMSNEGPQHRVTFDRGFAISMTEVTVGQFSEFVDDTGYRTDAEIAGASRVYNLNSGRMDEEDNVHWRHDYSGDDADEDLPVLHVSWRDANAYANWLSDQTGRNYRLPSEAEFEYALRAGSQSPYWWGTGSPPEDGVENVTGDGDVSPTGARWNVAFRRYDDGFWGPASVGSLEANPFGLHDMGGNVMEWVADCWHDSFTRAPADGSAWINPGCERRVIKGASWSSTPAMSRSAFRISSSTSSTDMRVGFRVARDL